MPTVTPDLTEFYRLARPKKPPCQVKVFSDLLDSAEQENLAAALAVDKGIINSGAIREWFHTRGHEVSISAITNHRGRVCTCYDQPA